MRLGYRRGSTAGIDQLDHNAYSKSSPVKERHPERFAEYEERVQRGEISVTDACKEMNIGITTYYRMRKDQIDHKAL